MKYIICLLFFFTLSGCADYIPLDQALNIPKVGFWHGLWHGIIFPIAWVVSLFSDSTAIYAIYNNGGWYDFGFFIGIGGFSASLFASKKRSRYKHFFAADRQSRPLRNTLHISPTYL